MTLRKIPMPKNPIIKDDGEVRELTREDMKLFRPVEEATPGLAKKMKRLRGQRGPQKSPIKEQVTLRLDQDVLAYFDRAKTGYQARINKALHEYIAAH